MNIVTYIHPYCYYCIFHYSLNDILIIKITLFIHVQINLQKIKIYRSLFSNLWKLFSISRSIKQNNKDKSSNQCVIIRWSKTGVYGMLNKTACRIFSCMAHSQKLGAGNQAPNFVLHATEQSACRLGFIRGQIVSIASYQKCIQGIY